MSLGLATKGMLGANRETVVVRVTSIVGLIRQVRIVGYIRMGEVRMASQRLKMVRGDSNLITILVKSKETSGLETAIDITGATAKLTVKKERNGTDPNLLQLTGAVTDAEEGELSFTFVPADTRSLETGTFYYDVQVTLPGPLVYTVALDTFELLPDITTD